MVEYTIREVETSASLTRRFTLEDFGPFKHHDHWGSIINLVIVEVTHYEADEEGNPECIEVRTSLRGYETTSKGVRDKRSSQGIQFDYGIEYKQLKEKLGRETLAHFLTLFPQLKDLEVTGL